MYDILATTDNTCFVNKNFKEEYVTHFANEKTNKIVFTEDDLYNADTFSFGTQIGSITNRGSSGITLLSSFKKGSYEHETTLNRLKTLPCIQNKEIDKTKNGKKTKGIPKSWVTYNKEDLTNNKILLDKNPYFFIYLYPDTRKKYKDYIRVYNKKSKQMFEKTLDNLLKQKKFSQEELDFLSLYNHKNPIISSNCVMNKICRKIEDLNTDISQEKNIGNNESVFDIYFNEKEDWCWDNYKKVIKEFDLYKKTLQTKNMKQDDFYKYDKYSDGEISSLDIISVDLKEYLNKVCSKESEVLNYLIYHIYKDKNLETGKELIWKSYGNILYANIKKNTNQNTFMFPIADCFGDITYLNKKYEIREVEYDK